MESEKNTNKLKNIFTKEQKHFIGSTLLGAGVIALTLSITLLITLLILVRLDFSIIVQAIKQGDVLISLIIAFLATGLVNFSTGITLRK
jgi:hypothetical protein